MISDRGWGSSMRRSRTTPTLSLRMTSRCRSRPIMFPLYGIRPDSSRPEGKRDFGQVVPWKRDTSCNRQWKAIVASVRLRQQTLRSRGRPKL